MRRSPGYDRFMALIYRGILSAVIVVAVCLVPVPQASAVHPGVRVVCITGSNSGGLVGRYLYKPRNCMFHRKGTLTTAGTILTVKRLRWKRWTGKRARATGKLVSNAGRFRIRLKLTKAQHPCGTTVFSRLTFKIKSPHSSTRSWRIDNCLV
jgi:hypothetical protein